MHHGAFAALNPSGAPLACAQSASRLVFQWERRLSSSSCNAACKSPTLLASCIAIVVHIHICSRCGQCVYWLAHCQNARLPDLVVSKMWWSDLVVSGLTDVLQPPVVLAVQSIIRLCSP